MYEIEIQYIKQKRKTNSPLSLMVSDTMIIIMEKEA
jgi:hypothetical protein